MYECRVERDSITTYGERLTTVVVTLPRIVLAELNTHRVFSRSSASSRAIPVQKQIDRLRNDPFIPVYWGKNQKGMQAEEELSDEQIARALVVWGRAREESIRAAEELLEIGVHKQITNRRLECDMWHTVIITATEWSNFDHLRRDKDAQPEIRKAADMIWEARPASTPRLCEAHGGDWHLPFIDGDDQRFSLERQVQISVGRSARVSYLNHDGIRAPEDDMVLAERCRRGHMAPWEHAARPMTTEERRMFERTKWIPNPELTTFTNQLPSSPPPPPRWLDGGTEYFLGNFNGWVQARKLIAGEWDILGYQA